MNKTKYKLTYTSRFKKNYKKILKQNKKLEKFSKVLNSLSNGETLDLKYKDHILYDDKYYNGCRECHIEPDWLLIYKYHEDELILVLVNTGSHSDLFR